MTQLVQIVPRNVDPNLGRKKASWAEEAGRGGPLFQQGTSLELYFLATSLCIQGTKLAVQAA